MTDQQRERAPGEPRSCLGCRHFVNDPEELEKVFPEILILSSTYGSTRAEAGVCALTETFRDPRFVCESYEPHPRTPPPSLP